MMIRRVRPKPPEMLRVVRGAILRNPQPRDQKPVIAQHIQQRDLYDDGPKELGPLGKSRTHQQSAIRASRRGQAVAARVAVVSQPFGGTYEIVEAVLLVTHHPRLMPRLTILPAAPNVRYGHDTSVLQPHQQ